MRKTAVVTARIDGDLAERLDRLAALRDRSRAWLIEKAIGAFVEEELALRGSLAEADAAIEAGNGIPHDEAMARLKAAIATRRAA